DRSVVPVRHLAPPHHSRNPLLGGRSVVPIRHVHTSSPHTVVLHLRISCPGWSCPAPPLRPKAHASPAVQLSRFVTTNTSSPSVAGEPSAQTSVVPIGHRQHLLSRPDLHLVRCSVVPVRHLRTSARPALTTAIARFSCPGWSPRTPPIQRKTDPDRNTQLSRLATAYTSSRKQRPDAHERMDQSSRLAIHELPSTCWTWIERRHQLSRLRMAGLLPRQPGLPVH